jgi:Tripartite tricarboxylate transporter family receptor
MRTGRQLAIAIVSSTIGLATAAHAQVPAADTRPITLVVPVAAGGGMDTIGRAIAERLAERLKQTVVVENRVGAGGAVGVDYVAKAAPDGRTLLLMDISAVLHKWLHKSILAAALSMADARWCGEPRPGVPADSLPGRRSGSFFRSWTSRDTSPSEATASSTPARGSQGGPRSSRSRSSRRNRRRGRRSRSSDRTAQR